ncbi:hypothetical protein TWF481_009741 [Arthrobotrys musiformis]|uniref:F-box domain-containing protein n=1 Tax=Arthrobotrys musiformis TaxID=47236 RepID=A0AAV9W4N3_9PEZI
MVATLLSLPQELIDMIFAEGLEPSDLGKVRRLSKDHNDRFKYHYWQLVFATIRVKLKPSSLERLIAAGTGSEALPFMQHVVFWPAATQSYLNRESPDHLKNPELVQSLAKTFSTLTHIKTVEIALGGGTNAAAYWKAVVDAILAAKSTTIEKLKAPVAAIQMSKFKPFASAKFLKLYRTSFRNLKSLEIHTSVQLENPTATAFFWSMVDAMGSKLEDLTVRNTRISFRDDPNPGSQKSYQSKNFSLPELKRLTLVDVAITPTDLKTLLGNSEGIEAIDICKCRMPKEKDGWFEVLVYLKDNQFPHLRELELAMNGTYNEYYYDLPKVSVKGNWRTEDCSVEVSCGGVAPGPYEFQANLWNELENNGTADKFWDSLTDRKWNSKQATRWKRRRRVEEEWAAEIKSFGNPDYIDEDDPHVQWVNSRHQGQLDALDVEADDE